MRNHEKSLSHTKFEETPFQIPNKRLTRPHGNPSPDALCKASVYVSSRWYPVDSLVAAGPIIPSKKSIKKD